MLIRRLGFDGSGLAFDGGLECFTGGFFAFQEDACKLTASFALHGPSFEGLRSLISIDDQPSSSPAPSVSMPSVVRRADFHARGCPLAQRVSLTRTAIPPDTKSRARSVHS